MSKLFESAPLSEAWEGLGRVMIREPEDLHEMTDMIRSEIGCIIMFTGKRAVAKATALFLFSRLDLMRKMAGADHGHTIGHKHGEGSSIDFYAYNSRIRPWNATFKVTFFVSTLILCIALNDPYISASVIIAMTYLMVVKGGLPLSSFLRILTIPITFILLGTAAIGVDFSTQPMGQYRLSLGFCYVFTSWDRLKMMAFLILKVFGAVSAMEAMALSTPASEIIGVLRRAHMPKLIVELMNIIYRYIFILIDVNINIRNSADSRLGFCDVKTSWNTFGKVASNILIVSLKKANTYFNAMEARCYDGEFMVLEEYEEIKAVQAVAASLFIAILFVIWGLTR